jgi:MerR family transcriptional regulator, copper efflux regulator
LGLSTDEWPQLLALYEDMSRVSADLKAIAQQKVAESDHTTRELQQLRNTPGHLVLHSHGDERPNGPIFDTLAEER